jgi:ribonucleoside-triphosphate reductase
MMDDVYKKSQSIMYVGDKENANTDSALVATKRSLVFNQLNKELYQKFFLTVEELQAARDGYIYIHDMSARRDTMNCCLFRVGDVLKNGFEMGNIWYNEPNSLDVAFDVIGDIVLSAASQQYGGFTVPEIDKILAPYAQKSYDKAFKKYNDNLDEELSVFDNFKFLSKPIKFIRKATSGVFNKLFDRWAEKDVKKEMEQGFQGLEYKFNTVGSSRGDYPFITFSAGLATDRWGKMASITMFDVRRKGQGKAGHKKPVLFPKLVFLYDKNLHGEEVDHGEPNRDVFEAGLACSSKTMYPDWLSLTGEGYVPSMYKKYGKVVSPMGCRAFLSPWYERGGMEPADENDVPVFEGRFNLGAISLNLPMILAKSRAESKDFYEVLDYYLELIRKLHIRTYNYIGELRASTNPLAYCEGGFYGGNLNPHDKIKSILRPMTMSYGITALNELQELYNGHSLAEEAKAYIEAQDKGEKAPYFALEVMEYINKKLDEYKHEDNILYAVYGTPAENLCGLQIKQFRKMYGYVENVSDREYVSNSFHCHVTEDITPVQKQDYEGLFWNLFNGGKIQYVRYNIGYNIDAMKTLIIRAMRKGFYEGVNLSLTYCDDCGYEAIDIGDTCPKCGSKNLTKIDRMNGYLAYSRVKGDTRLNSAKMAEIADRKSM